MEQSLKIVAFCVFCASVYFGADSYFTSNKAQKAIEAGLQECTEVNTFGHSIIVYKKECK